MTLLSLTLEPTDYAGAFVNFTFYGVSTQCTFLNSEFLRHVYSFTFRWMLFFFCLGVSLASLPEIICDKVAINEF